MASTKIKSEGVKGEIPEQLKVTSFDDLKTYSEGQLVELPSFAEGQPFVAKLRRPSLLMMMKSNEFPNDLLVAANALFTGNAANVAAQSDDMYKKSTEVFEKVAQRALVEPTFAQIKELAESHDGFGLTDEQLVFIFNYAQDGVKFLKQFRTDSSDN